jgi:predicted dehydrogenase
MNKKDCPSSTNAAIRIGIIGCGAVTELNHFPPLLVRQDCRVTALVDRNPTRLDVLGRLIPQARRAASVAEVLSDIDAAIVAVPHFLHAAVACELLRAGKHVLVEKPLALSSTECDQMLAAAKASGSSIAVGHMRRFCPAVVFARELLRSNTLGTIRCVDVTEGGVFGWPVESDFQFRREKAGGGVLVDTGAHTLDMLINWFGDIQPFTYHDDAGGGVEADCVAELRLPEGIPCRVELSRTRNLRNSAIIEAARGRMEVFFYDNKVVLTFADGSPVLPFECTPQVSALSDPSMWRHMFDYQLDDWLGALAHGRPAIVSGEVGAKVVRLIEKLQAMREPCNHPWETFTAGRAS